MCLILSRCNALVGSHCSVVLTLLQERLNDFDETALSILASCVAPMEDTPNVGALKKGMRSGGGASPSGQWRASVSVGRIDDALCLHFLHADRVAGCWWRPVFPPSRTWWPSRPWWERWARTSHWTSSGNSRSAYELLILFSPSVNQNNCFNEDLFFLSNINPNNHCSEQRSFLRWTWTTGHIHVDAKEINTKKKKGQRQSKCT